jgi:enoyl-CoA hydratase
VARSRELEPPTNGLGIGSRTESAARALAAKLASKSPKAMRLAKWSLNGIELLDIKKSYRFEQGFTLELYTSRDSQEARDAFVEKRDASFDKQKK